MAKFQFRLETLLKLREAERQQRRLELAQALQADQLLETQVAAVIGEVEHTRARGQQAVLPGTVHVDELRDIHRYAAILKAKLQTLRDQQTRLRAEIDRRRQVLVEADRQVKVLEKVREHQWEEHLAEQLRLEARDLDEVAQRTARSV